MPDPTPSEAAAALTELIDADRAVRRAETDRLPLVLAAHSVLVAVDYAAKDLLTDRVARRAVSAGCLVLALAVAAHETHRSRVQPVSVDPDDLGPRAAAPLMAATAAWYLAERILVACVRRSRVGRPNLLIGATLAVTRPLGYLGVQRLLPRPGRGA